MEFKDPRTAGQLVVAVDVLCDGHHPGGRFELDQGPVGRVGFSGGNEAAAPVVPAPDQFGVAGEGAGRGQVLGPVLAPQAVLGAAKGRDAAGSRNSGPG
jgi:hypothetical protein